MRGSQRNTVDKHWYVRTQRDTFGPQRPKNITEKGCFSNAHASDNRQDPVSFVRQEKVYEIEFERINTRVLVGEALGQRADVLGNTSHKGVAVVGRNGYQTLAYVEFLKRSAAQLRIFDQDLIKACLKDREEVATLGT